MAMTTTQQTQAYQFFIVAFGAAPGVTYMNQIADAYASGMSTKDIVNTYTTKAEFTSVYPSFFTNEQFAAKLIENVVGSSATEAAKTQAKADVVAAINSGYSRGDVVYQVFSNLASKPATDADWAGTAKQMANQVTVAQYYTETLLANTTDLTTLKAVVSGVTNTTDVTDPAAVIANSAAATTGKTITLTTSVDSGTAFTGGTSNDTFIAAYNATGTANTLGALDVLDGGTGTDTLQITQDTGAFILRAATLTSIEKITIRGAAGVTADTTGANITGLTSVAVTQATSATLTAGTSTDVTVSGVTGAIGIDGGKAVTVTDSTANANITIGATTVSAGAVTVTDTAQGTGVIAIDGGTAVTVTATNADAAGGAITVGNGGVATDLPSGAVKITSAHAATAATDVAMGNITAKGGSTITVTQTADTSKAATDTTGATLTQGTVTVVGGNGTSSVTVTQAASTAEVLGVTAVAGVTETASVKFGALKAGDILIIGGDGDATLEAGELQLTATVDMTAAEVAAAFSGLVKGTVPVAGDTQGSAAAAKGTFDGALTGWTSGSVATDTVVFTSTTANSNATDLAQKLTGTGTAPTITTTAGSAATDGVTGVLGVITGVVTIDDAATAAITTVSVDGYGTGSKIGNTTTLSKLSSLSLANSGGATAGASNATMLVDAAGVATLNLTLNKVKGAVSLDDAADSALKTLNVTTTGADSAFALTAASAEALAVAGTKALDLTGSTLSALKTVTVSGSAGLTVDASGVTVTSVNTSATTGNSTVTLDGSKATYTGGAGADAVTLSSTTVSKAISLGAGDDTLTLATGTTAASSTLSGGDGTDTLSMAAADAVTLSAAATFEAQFDGFEKVGLGAIATAGTVDLANLDDINYVVSAGGTKALTLSNYGANGTLELSAGNSAGTTASLASSAGTSDVFNVVLKSAGALTGGVVTVAGVETVNITTTDTNTTAHANTLTLTAAAATKVTVGGNTDLTLTMTGSTAVTTIDGSAMTKALTVTSLNTTAATTITGGSANDVLTAATGTTADVLTGGAGDDTLTANAGLDTLTGGVGNDVFVIGTASVNSSSYATITDFAAGDLIKLTGATTFTSAKVTLGDTAVFQDYANAAINTLAANGAGWFQYSGNTYIVADMGAGGTSFANSEDFIVKLTGLVDLSSASFNTGNATIAL